MMRMKWRRRRPTPPGKVARRGRGSGRAVAERPPAPLLWISAVPSVPRARPWTRIFLVLPSPSPPSWVTAGVFRKPGGREEAPPASGGGARLFARRGGPPSRRRAGNLSKCAGLRIIGARSGGVSGLLPWRVHKFRKVLPFAHMPPPLWSWRGTDGEGLFAEKTGGFRFLAQRTDDEGGKFLRNRPAPQRWPRRSRPQGPASARGAGTGAATCAVRELQVSDGKPDSMAFSSRGASQPDPATEAAGGRRAEERFGETTAQCPGERAGSGWCRLPGPLGGTPAAGASALRRGEDARNCGNAFRDLTQKSNGSTRRLRYCVPVNVSGAASIHCFLAQHS